MKLLLPLPSNLTSRSLIMQSAGYHLAFSFVLCKFTRGKNGVRTVCHYILSHWSQFTGDFDGFCIGLVKHCRKMCVKHGRTYLSHREGLRTGRSGYHFIHTLVRRSCRHALGAAAEVSFLHILPEISRSIWFGWVSVDMIIKKYLRQRINIEGLKQARGGHLQPHEGLDETLIRPD